MSNGNKAVSRPPRKLENETLYAQIKFQDMNVGTDIYLGSNYGSLMNGKRQSGVSTIGGANESVYTNFPTNPDKSGVSSRIQPVI